MAVRKILTLGAPREKILHTKAKKVTRFDPYLQRLVEDMWETMRAAPGVGLAGPQIGESIRVLVAEYEDEHVALVNPEILSSEGKVLGTEGCLSIPGYVGDNVPRAESVSIKGRDPKGKEIRLHATGWWARILQHEIDHLDGILYTDRITPADVREVTEEDVAQEGAPIQNDRRAQANANGVQADSTRSRGRDASGTPGAKVSAGQQPRTSKASAATGGERA
jgi:peptide deformylase